MKAVNPVDLVLLGAQPFQVFDAVLDGLDVAEHHGGRGIQAQPVRRIHDASQSSLIALSGEMRWRTRSTRISPPPPGMEPRPAARKSAMIFSSGSWKTSAEMDELAGAEAVDVHLRELLLHVDEQVEVPLLGQLGMVPALEQDLRAAQRDCFLDLSVHLPAG